MFQNKLFFSFSLGLIVSLLQVVSPGHAGNNSLDDEAGSPSSRSVQVRSAQHLLTPEDHSNFLIDALNSAKKNVTICSYNLDPRHLLETGIARALKNAADKSVKIYIYYAKTQSDYPMIDVHLQQLGKFCTRLEETSNHAKCVVKDKECVAIGSHDWLAKPWDRSLNASWVVSGNLAGVLKKDILSGVKFHQSLADGNKREVRSFFRNVDNFCFGQAEFDHGQTFYAMVTPEAHHQFLDAEVFRKAQRKIVLCSPFIRLERLKEVLSERRLKDLERRNVRLSVVTLAHPCRDSEEEADIFQYLEYLKEKFGNFSFRTQEGLHAKSVIVDKELLLAGSFNCLSAVDSSDHQASNNEVSVALRGAEAREKIQRLQQDPQWKLLFPSSSSSTGQKARKRKREDMLGGDAKRRKSTSSQSSQEDQRYASRVKTFSGKRFGKEGFCAQIDGNTYVADKRNSTLYFNTPEEARKAAYGVLTAEEESEESSSEKEEIPEHFLSQIQVFPDNRGNREYCVCRFKKYLTSGRSILYFSTPEEALLAAYHTWGLG